ncbi:MAG: TLD domain-containing protein, partial [Terracidiphilus sp.]|nr:TLD domain-containing protein [Terracidiphilus sp.]
APEDYASFSIRESGQSAVAHTATLQRSITTLTLRIHALSPRLAASQASVAESAQQLAVALVGAGREAAVDTSVLASCVGKALEGAAEEARVRAAQLAACAELLEREAEGGEEEVSASAAVARALLSVRDWDAAVFAAVDCHSTITALGAVDDTLRIRDGVDPAKCTVAGTGLTTYRVGEFDNPVSVCGVDGVGDVVESIEAEDVCVSLSVEGSIVTRVSVGEAGQVDVMYRVPEGAHKPIRLGMSVCGAVLPGSPWTVTFSPLTDSAILASVAPERIAEFLRELTVWLPARAYSLLYRGSRDGMTAAAFHRLCDGKGPTLVLVRCDKGWVFGGHAGASWHSPTGSVIKTIPSADAFLFSVCGPHTRAPVRFPVKAGMANRAQRCAAYSLSACVTRTRLERGAKV